jgi:hypothetical protein
LWRLIRLRRRKELRHSENQDGCRQAEHQDQRKGVDEMARVRDYKHEYESYHAKPEQIKNRAKRNSARAEMKDKLGASAIAGKDVHHQSPIRNGGGNGKGNLAITGTSHRGWNRKK